MGNLTSNVLEKMAGVEGIDLFFFFQDANKMFIVATSTGIESPTFLTESFLFSLFLLIGVFKKVGRMVVQLETLQVEADTLGR